MCFLISMHAMGGNRMADMMKTMMQMQSANPSMESSGLLSKENAEALLKAGVPTDSPLPNSGGGPPNLMALLSGAVPVAEPKQAETPRGPNTLIRYAPPTKNGETGHSEAIQMPADARVIIVDGRMQICYPHGKPGKGK